MEAQAVTKDQRRLLENLKDTKDRGAFALACDGAPRAVAHELTKLGYAEWKGTSWGSSFWAITESGEKALSEN